MNQMISNHFFFPFSQKRIAQMCALSCTLGLWGGSLPAYAENIMYTGQNGLQAFPAWSGMGTGSNNLYSGSPTAPSMAGNAITVDFTTGTKPDYVIGGMANNSTEVKDNTVSIIQGEINYHVIGGRGYASSGNINVKENSVLINDGIVGYYVYGGSGQSSSNGTVNIENNTVFINGGAVKRGVFGGYGSSYNGGVPVTVTGNKVFMSGGIVGEVVQNGVVGGHGYSYTETATVADNMVDISSGTVKGNVVGGEGGVFNAPMSTYITGNSVMISGGSVAGNVLGGYSINSGGYVSSGNVTMANNKVTVTGGSVMGTIYGGAIITGNYGNDLTITNNEVNISGGSIGDVVGGYSNSSAGGNVLVTNNTINISDNPIFASSASIVGGYQVGSSITYDVFTGNTLNWSAQSPVTLQTIANFEHYNFTLNPALANTGNALIRADTIVLGTDATNNNTGVNASSKITVVGIHSGSSLNAGDEFILMRSGLAFDGYGAEGFVSTGVAQQGISLLYDVKTAVDLANKEVTATILKLNPSENGGVAQVNPQLKALSEGYLAGLMLVTRGADNIAYDAFNAINEQNHQNGFVPFVIASGSHSRYNSGSHIKSNDFLLTGGLSYQQDNVTVGAFLESGWGNYDSYNSFYNAANVDGDGNTRYFGAGLLGRYDFANGVYTDTSIRFGRNRTKFDTTDILNIITGQFASYNIKTNYVSAHIGVGYLFSLKNKNELDFTAKYLYSTVGSKDVHVTGDPIHFDRVDSNRVRINSIFNHHYSDAVTFNAGLGYEYEFDGKARATTYGIYNIEAPSVKGGTGIVSLGAIIKPIINQNLSLDFTANGYTGKREGVGARIRLNYVF